jgi:PTS system cellobiose-specific IIC component
MNKFMEVFEAKFVPIAAKFGSQKHLVAIRDSFAATLPLILAGAMAVLINNVFFVPWGLVAGFTGGDHPFIVWTFENLAPLFSVMESGTFSIISLALAFAIAYNRATAEKQDPLANGLIAVGSIYVLGILSRSYEGMPSSWIGNYLGSLGLFVAMIIPLITSEIFFWANRKNFTIKMPDQVPPAVAKAFAAVIPGFFALFTMAVVAYFFQLGESGTIFLWFEINISQTLLALGENLFAISFASFMSSFFWFFGLHGMNMLAPFLDSIYGVLQLENLEMFSQGITTLSDGLNPWVRLSWDIYTMPGGSGATLGLLIAILLTSKVKQHKEIAQLATPAGIFQINEPVTFGIPLVLNPIFFIPFTMVPVVLTLVGYFATTAGIAGPVVNTIPWTTPPVISAFLATNGSLGATLVALVNLVLSVVMYLPFVLIANNMDKEA